MALPRLAFVYDPMSVTPMGVAEAARGLARLVFVVDLGDPALGPLAPLFRRLGDVVDTNGIDKETIADRLAEHEPTGIMTLAEQQLPMTAQLAASLSLPFFDQLTAGRLADKFEQRRTLADAGLPGPDFWAIADDATPTDLRRAAYPAVLKPRRSTASRQTVLVANEASLLRALRDNGPEPGGYLLERYLPDESAQSGSRSDCVAVETIVQAGRVLHLALTGRFPMAPPFRGAGSYLPGTADGELQQAVFDATTRAVTALGIHDGCLNTDLKLTPEGAVVIEVNGRVGGNVPELFELAGGPPLMTLAMRIALGQTVELTAPVTFERIAYYLWEQPPMSARGLLAVDGLSAVAALPGVERVVLNRRPGDALDWRRGGWDHVFSVLGAADGLEQIHDVRRRIPALVAIKYDIGELASTTTFSR